MDGEDERSGQTREEQISRLVALPMACRAAPTQGKRAEDQLLSASACAIPQSGQVRQQTDVPKNDRYGEVGGDGKNVPDEGAAELRPQAHGVRVGDDPIEKPRPSEVDEWKHAGASDGEKSHRFGEAIDGGAPFLVK